MEKQLNILLLGEYSNYFNNLAKGLKELGHNVVLASTGDRYKNYYRDIDLAYQSGGKIKNSIKRIWIENTKIKLFKNFDVVQIINPNVFARFGNNISLFKKIIKNNDKVFLSLVGDDYFWWNAYRKGKFTKSPHKGNLIDENGEKSVWETSKGLRKATEFLAENVDGIIPGAAIYKIAYNHLPKCRNVIPMPIDVSRFEHKENVVKDKIIFYHGGQLGRYGFKGTREIDLALNEMADKYSSDLIYKRTDSVPFNEYSKLLDQTNILIDQANSPEPAMNALISMLKGKLVMGGCEKMFLETHNLEYNPLINITNNVDQIKSQVEWILDNRTKISDLSLLGRKYVEDNHDAIKVAKQFIKEWSKSV